MSYQSYLNNRELQQSLQGMFGQVQTEDEQSSAEAQQTDTENRDALGGEKSQERESGAETAGFGLAELSGTEVLGSLKTALKNMASDAIDSVKAKFADTIADARGQVTSRISGVQEQFGSRFDAARSQARSQFQEMSDNLRTTADDVASRANVLGDETFSRLSSGVNFGKTDIQALPNYLSADPEVMGQLGSNFTRGETVVSQPAKSAAPVEAETGIAETDAYKFAADTAIKGGLDQGGTELATMIEGKAVPTVAEGVAEKIAPDLIAGGLEVPGLDVIAGVAGIAYGLYDLFKHVNTNAPPPPPQMTGVSQSIATVQAGI